MPWCPELGRSPGGVLPLGLVIGQGGCSSADTAGDGRVSSVAVGGDGEVANSLNFVVPVHTMSITSGTANTNRRVTNLIDKTSFDDYLLL